MVCFSTQELRRAQIADVIKKREEDEMELSDDDYNEEVKSETSKRTRNSSHGSSKTFHSEGPCSDFENETGVWDASPSSSASSDSQAKMMDELKILQKTVQGLQHQLLTLKQEKDASESVIKELKKSLETKRKERNSESCENCCDPSEPIVISLVSVYLSVHPLGCATADLVKFIKSQSSLNHVNEESLSSILCRYPLLFRKSEEAGSWLWKYDGFNYSISNSIST